MQFVFKLFPANIAFVVVRLSVWAPSDMEKHKMWAVPAGWRVGMLSGVQRRKINDSEVNYDCFYITNDISVMCVCAIFYGHRNTVTVKSCAYTFQSLRWNFTVNVTNCAYTFFCYDFRFYADRHRNRKILVAHTLYFVTVFVTVAVTKPY